MQKHLLVVDDEGSHRLMIRAVLEDAGWRVTEAVSGEQALALVRATPMAFHVVLLDMKMPGMDGQATLQALLGVCPGLPVVMLTAYGTVGTAVEAMKNGAFDYLTKPADNDELVITLERAYEFCSTSLKFDGFNVVPAGQPTTELIVGNSKAVHHIHDFIRQAGPSEATILITGESGTGKELIAESLHRASLRRDHVMIRVNCAALPAQLLESELFGYQKGAFTGAMKDKPGRFQLANGGTLFLDEIGELPLDLQAKLLRVLQDRQVEPLGSVRPVTVDVRILAATNRHLPLECAKGTFREDLYFRLNVLEIQSPPLRERLEDLPLLVNHLLRGLTEKNRKSIRGVSPQFLEALMAYRWPGNVRELENVLEHSLILSRSDILQPDVLPSRLFEKHTHDRRKMPSPLSSALAEHEPAAEREGFLKKASDALAMHAIGGSAPDHESADGAASSLLEQAEREALLLALIQHKGHRERTADALGISRRTLQYKLKKYGMTRR